MPKKPTSTAQCRCRDIGPRFERCQPVVDAGDAQVHRGQVVGSPASGLEPSWNKKIIILKSYCKKKLTRVPQLFPYVQFPQSSAPEHVRKGSESWEAAMEQDGWLELRDRAILSSGSVAQFAGFEGLRSSQQVLFWTGCLPRLECSGIRLWSHCCIVFAFAKIWILKLN